MEYDDRLGSNVLNQIRSLPFWEDFEDRVAVAIVGSVGAGIDDVNSDLDVYLLVPEEDSIPLYENYKRGYEESTIDVLTPRAFQCDEFPIVKLGDMDGHHQAIVFESIEENVRNYSDVDRWVWRNSIPLHDPHRRLESLRAESAEYPSQILNRKLIRHYWFLRDNFWSTKKPLERGQRETISLLCVQGISHLLKFCVLAEGKPYPYDKWLYRVAIETNLGRMVRRYVDALFEEIHRKDIIYEKPAEYVKPGHRNEQYENYRIYHLLNLIRKALEDSMPDLKKDKYALSDRIGAWKPR
jgi:hypothetical protein